MLEGHKYNNTVSLKLSQIVGIALQQPQQQEQQQ